MSHDKPRGPQACLAESSIPGFISQGIGRDPESHGYHCPDGQYKGRPYSAAVDITISGLTKIDGLTGAQKGQFCELLKKLRNCGFAAWFRSNGETGDTTENEIHLIDPSLPCIKDQLVGQLRNYIRHKYGQGGGKGYGTKDPCGLANNRGALLLRYGAPVTPGYVDPWGNPCKRPTL